MFDEFEKEDDSWRPEPPKVAVIAKKAVGYLFAAFVIFIIGFLVIRSITSQPPRAMKNVLWDETLYGAFQTEKAAGTTLKIDRINAPNSFSESNMFSVYTILYTPSVGQLQVTVRYNERLLNYLAEDYPESAELVKAGKDVYTFNLTYRKDDTLHTVSSYESVRDEKGGYTYYRLIFEGITLEGVVDMTVNACYVGRPEMPRESVTVYSSGYPVLPFDYKAPKGANKDVKAHTPAA